MAVVAYPSWAYHQTQAAQIVANDAAFNALTPAGTWSKTPFAAPLSAVPIDPGFQVTDTRLQQSLIEQRITNLMLLHLLGPDPNQVDLLGLRTDVLSQDSSLVT